MWRRSSTGCFESFEIGKLILAAILGGAVAFGFNLLTEIIKTMRVDSRVQKPRP